MRKVIGVGETILDILFKNSQPHKAAPGGSVFNALVSLGRLNVPISFISEVGNDHVGEIIKTFMEENNIPSKYVNFYPNGKSPISLAFLDDKNNANYMFYKEYPKQRLDSDSPEIKADDIVVFGSFYALNPALREKITELLEYAQKQKAIIYYDPNFRKTHVDEALKLRPAILENLEYADIVRGSDEDFFYIFGANEIEKIYKNHIEFYCKNLLITQGADNIRLYTKNYNSSFEVPEIEPLSTIGAGDNFNAGILYALLKYDIKKEELDNLDKETWQKIIQCGIDFSTEVCLSYDNYISRRFAENYQI
ncbi:MAG: carbohydrate kinase [Bacteroidales bacterium]|nr:carbohydrate kinase [Bacteroidales bacterium]